MDYESTANLFTSLTDEQKWIVIGQIPDDMLWDELYGRYKKKSQKLENIEKATRA
jgi:hypothetical protein